jgi:two-component system phosphate regulon sensor histidine kinase PhoR
MWQSRFFWRLFLTYGVLWIGSVGLLGAIVVQRMEQVFLRQAEEQLQSRAALLREVVRGRSKSQTLELQRKMEELDRETGTRITLLAEDGTVLAESQLDPRQQVMENHADRPEVVEAREHGVGVSQRQSTTFHKEMMYVALRSDDTEGEVRYIRLALPLDWIQRHLAGLQFLIWTAVGLTALAGVGLAFWLARGQVRPLTELARVARQIAAGDYSRKVYPIGRDEVAALGDAFNHMSEQLASQFAKLEEERQQLHAILSGMVEGVVALDSGQRILFANERAGRLLEFQNQEPVGKKLWQVVRQRALQDLVQRALTSSGLTQDELTWSDGSNKSLTVHAARLPGDPPRGAVLVLHDTSDLRRLERLRQDFVANVSHELKTPLAVIKACVETLLDGAVDDVEHRGSFLEKISDQSDRLHALILDLLSLARIESGAEVFQMEELAVSPLVRACLERHQARAQTRRQVLQASGLEEAQVCADGEAVSQILDNLVDNAVKYTPEGGDITVSWRRDDGQVVLEVADNGIGIPEQDLQRIFERFYRVDKARSRELGGTGLGLSIVKHLAQAMHGSVTASSELGKGTTFTVRLPTND